MKRKLEQDARLSPRNRGLLLEMCIGPSMISWKTAKVYGHGRVRRHVQGEPKNTPTRKSRYLRNVRIFLYQMLLICLTDSRTSVLACGSFA